LLRKQLEGYSLTTAEILYRLPDYRSLLQTYIWQEYDMFPLFPILSRFLAFWAANLDGPLYQVTVTHKKLISPQDFKFVGYELRLH
jgi:uncharacterized protein Usg